MKAQIITITLFASIILSSFYSNAQTELISFESQVAEIYKGNIEDAADYIADFPTNAEAEEILNNLSSISEEIRGMLYNEIPADSNRINEIRSYVLGTFRKTEILQWNLLHIYQHQSIHLLPGEGITLTLKSYCLDHSAASPDPDEFYYIDEIPADQAEWLKPLMNYVTNQPDKEFPVQGLIWNMNKEIAFNDLPTDQGKLLRSAIPDAEERYGKDIIDKGVDQTFKLTINSTNYDNFRLFGANSMTTDGGLSKDPNLRKALWIRACTLVLTGSLIIPRVMLVAIK